MVILDAVYPIRSLNFTIEWHLILLLIGIRHFRGDTA